MIGPHARYVTFLVAAGFNDEEIGRMVGVDGFPPPDPGELTALHIALADRPAGFTLDDPAHEPSASWLRAHRLTGLARRDAPTTQAIRLLRSQARTAVELLLLGRVSPADVAHFLTQNAIDGVTTAGVQAFVAYFWDTEATPLESLLAVRQGHPRRQAYAEALSMDDDELLETARRALGGNHRKMLMTNGASMALRAGMHQPPVGPDV